MATQKQKQRAADVLMKAIMRLEAAQNSATVRACNVDHSRINKAKDEVHSVIKELERD